MRLKLIQLHCFALACLPACKNTYNTCRYGQICTKIRTIYIHWNIQHTHKIRPVICNMYMHFECMYLYRFIKYTMWCTLAPTECYVMTVSGGCIFLICIYLSCMYFVYVSECICLYIEGQARENFLLCLHKFTGQLFDIFDKMYKFCCFLQFCIASFVHFYVKVFTGTSTGWCVKQFQGFRKFWSIEQTLSGEISLSANKCTNIEQTISPDARNEQTQCKLNSQFAIPAQQQLGRAAGKGRVGPGTTPKWQGLQGSCRGKKCGATARLW